MFDWGLGIGYWGLGPIPNIVKYLDLFKNFYFIFNNKKFLFTMSF